MWLDAYDISKQEWIDLIDNWILNEKYRAVVKRKWLDGVTGEKVAEEFDLSPRHVSQICYRCKCRILPHIPSGKKTK